NLVAIAGQDAVQSRVRRGQRQRELAPGEAHRVARSAEMDGTAEELLELRDLVIAQVAELYLRRAETGVGEEARAWNEGRGAEFDGLAGVRPSGIVEMKVEHYFLRWVAQAHVHGLVEDVQVAAQHLQRFAEVPAAEGRIDEQPVVARVGFLRRQL